MLEIGRLCVKIAGRDAGEKCAIVDILDDKHVLIDGRTRRRKCSIKHLEPLEMVVKIKKGASHADVAKEFKKLGLEARETKPKKAKPRPRKQRGKKKKAEKEKAEEEGEKKKKVEKKEPKKEKAEKKEVKKEVKEKKSAAKKTTVKKDSKKK